MPNSRNYVHELDHVTINNEVDTISNGDGNITSIKNNKKNDNRTAWSGKLQFFLSIIGYSIGLGNIWRFPYLCQQNGGGAFIISYVCMLVLEGIPLFLIELGLGQRMRQGSLGVWNTINPSLGGIGIASCIVTFFVTLYYNVIIAWCLFYLFKSLQDLPWTECPFNTTTGKVEEECAVSSSTAYFWYRSTLDIAPSIETNDSLKWWIVLSLLFTWCLVFYFMNKGIQSTGKVIYFTSVFPYIILTILFIRGVTLKGAGIGLAHMYIPQVAQLWAPKVWLDAATQVFYSFGSAFGTLIAFGSYNRPENNCVRDVILVSVCNAFTAIYASSVVFTILGFQAVSNVEKCFQSNRQLLYVNEFLTNLNSSEDEYQEALISYNNYTNSNFTLEDCSVEKQFKNGAEGTGLAFIVFTEAIIQLPSATLWSSLFFIMLLSLGYGSQIGLLEGVFCVIFDIKYFKRFKKQYIIGIICILYFLIGLIFCTGAGEYWLELFDSFSSSIGLGTVAFMEIIAVAYIYGHEKFTKDIEDMTGYRPGIYWQLTWRYLSPVIMGCVLSSSIYSMIIKRPQYYAWNMSLGKTVPTDYPNWVLGIGIGIIITGVTPILIVFMLRKFQWKKFHVDFHKRSIRRIDTTVSTRGMIRDADLDEQNRLENFPVDAEGSDDNNIGGSNMDNNHPDNEYSSKGFEM